MISCLYPFQELVDGAVVLEYSWRMAMMRIRCGIGKMRSSGEVGDTTAQLSSERLCVLCFSGSTALVLRFQNLILTVKEPSLLLTCNDPR